MYSEIRATLDICSFFALLTFIALIGDVLSKQKNLATLLADIGKCAAVVVILVNIAGIANFICYITIKSHDFGAMYEARTYKQSYEALAYTNSRDESIFCIVDIVRDVGVYHVPAIHLPFGKKFTPNDNDCEYNPEESYNVITGNSDREMTIELGRQTKPSSYDILKATSIANYGYVCASSEEEIWHYTGCPLANNIKAKNLVYFHNEAEAELLGFKTCKWCFKNY